MVQFEHGRRRVEDCGDWTVRRDVRRVIAAFILLEEVGRKGVVLERWVLGVWRLVWRWGIREIYVCVWVVVTWVVFYEVALRFEVCGLGLRFEGQVCE